MPQWHRRHPQQPGGGLGKLFKKAFTGEGMSLMKVSGSGEVFLAQDADEVFVLYPETRRSPSQHQLDGVSPGQLWETAKKQAGTLFVGDHVASHVDA